MSNLAGSVHQVPRAAALTASTDHDAEARAWVRALQSRGAERERAAAELHALLLRASRFELRRRRRAWDGSGDSIDDLATQAADNALCAILLKVGDYRFESRFTTWAYKFAILEAAVLARRRAWQDRELPIDPEAWSTVADSGTDLVEDLATRERLRLVTAAIQTELSPHQREVLTALVLADVPIDVLAERLNTTRGALYKTLHDARRKLRKAVDPSPADD
jgi:RNA polymerase sigma-70 factor (ECF subfamily)